MPTRSDTALLSKGLARASQLAKRDLDAFWSTLDKRDMVKVRNALEGFFPALVDTYGEVAATVAADWYEGLYRELSSLSPSASAEKVNSRMRWALTAGFNGDPDQALSTLKVVTDELVKQVGRDTVVRSAQRNGRRYARVPTGPETCDFCLMTASRGFVYESAATAGEMAKFHGNCDCQIVPDDGQTPDGYDPDALYEQYKRNRE